MSDPTHWPKFNPGEAPLETLVKLSRYYGANPEFVIAGGGNTSYKDGESLFVKASGTELGVIGPEGFVALRRADLSALIQRKLSKETAQREAEHTQALMSARIAPERGQRPSVESLMHHVIPGRFVIHTHSTEMNQLTCCVRGESLARELYGDQIAWIPFVDPGYVLSLTISRALADWRNATGRERPRAILMKNHGIIVAGDSPESIREETEWLISIFRSHRKREGLAEAGPPVLLEPARRKELAAQIAPTLAELLAGDNGPRCVRFSDAEPVATFVGLHEGGRIAGGGPLTPDQIVYCKSFPLWLKTQKNETPEALRERLAESIAAHKKTTHFAPKVVLVARVGMFAAGDGERGAQIVEMVYADAIKIMLGARALGGVQYLSKRDREFIDNWEVEAYRRKVSAGA